ncbi:hypothetical protein PQX77_002933 [Marasmius sp. AFHP31]|nr:hypothetical protein PQX77_002933 [Marasmius sp. AFHP31]
MSDRKRYSSCKVEKSIVEFVPPRATCKPCLEKDKAKRKEKSKKGNNRIGDVAQLPTPADQDAESPETPPTQDEVISLQVCVDITPIHIPEDLQKTADAVADWIWELVHYRFIDQSKYDHKKTPSTRFHYHCCQIQTRQHKPIKKNGPGVKNNNKGQMAAFECKGWLHITVFEDVEEAHINFRHKDQHVHYYHIDIPEDVKKYVADNVAMHPEQLWTAILEKFGQPRFSRSLLYAFWSSLSNSDWRRDDDELKSAKILIKEASQLQHSAESNKQIYEVEKNTKKSRFEIFALLGEVYGSGCPLGYLLIQSSPNHAEWEDGKQRYLEALLSYFHKKWSPRVVVTLTDKDHAEINAFHHCFPEAKHQLCFWHCLHAVKTHLFILRRRPAHYNPINAKADFSFVDPDFVPISQLTSQQVASADMYVAQSAIPQLTICLGGVLQNQVPPQLPKLILRINGEAVHSYQEKVKAGNNSLPTSLNLDSELDNPDLADNDLSEAVEQMDTETDQEDGPDWMFEAGETSSRDPNYIFCHAPHRKQLLHLFTKYFCLHPFFRSRGGLTLSAKQIQLNSAHGMYKFCKDRGLREVWAYMYNC